MTSTEILNPHICQEHRLETVHCISPANIHPGGKQIIFLSEPVRCLVMNILIREDPDTENSISLKKIFDLPT